MNIHTIVVAGVFVLGLAALSSPPAANGAEREQIVIDDFTVPQLRAEIEKIQTEFYKVFNSLNDDGEFDIICQKFTATGSNIPQVGCEPKFVTKRRGENANDYRLGVDELMSTEGTIKELQPQFELLTAKMNEIASKNEYFRELSQILQMLRGRLTELGQ